MRAIAAALALTAAGCGPGGEPAANLTPEEIERLAVAPEEKADPLATVRLAPLAPDEVASEGLAGPGCSFRRGGRTLFVAIGSDAVAKVGGELRHLVPTAPAGPSGGFFEDRQLSVSVGRTEEASADGPGGLGWPARIRVTNRRTGVDLTQHGRWACGS